MATNNPPAGKHPSLLSGILMRMGSVAFSLILLALILFIAAGRLDWLWAWVFLGIYLLDVAINATFLLRTGLETIAERGRPKEMKDWDKVVGGLWGVAMYLALPLVAGLDARFTWTLEYGTAWHVVGGVILALGLGLFSWAMIVNAYFSTTAYIQSERGQKVCRSGPYQFVRHPGYVGAIIQSIGIPLLLGSAWAFIPAIAAVICMVIRTAFEDRMLQAELPGYPEYARDVHYRLLPGVW